MNDESKYFTETHLCHGDEGLYAALIGTLCSLMDPMVDELDGYEIAKEILTHVDALDFETLELIVARIKTAARHEQEITWN